MVVFCTFVYRLYQCGITDVGCVALASSLRTNPSSQLKELNLNCNRLGTSGQKLLSDLLKDPNRKLKTLQ